MLRNKDTYGEPKTDSNDLSGGRGVPRPYIIRIHFHLPISKAILCVDDDKDTKYTPTERRTIYECEEIDEYTANQYGLSNLPLATIFAANIAAAEVSPAAANKILDGYSFCKAASKRSISSWVL